MRFLAFLLVSTLVFPGLASADALRLPLPQAASTPGQPSGGPSPGGHATVDPLLEDELRDGLAHAAILSFATAFEPDIRARLEADALTHHVYERLDMASVLANASQVEDMAQWPGVEVVWRNEKMRPYLDRSVREIGANLVWDQFGDRGAGVTILVVDTGIDGTHPDVRLGANLKDNVVPSQFSNDIVGGHQGGVPNSDADGHGTHVAGIIAGTGGASSGKYRGVAPAASLIGFAAGTVDAAGGEASFSSVSVLEGYEYALDQKDARSIRIVSNSWGANGKFEPDSPVNRATLNLYRAGLVVTFAAGNEGNEGLGTLNRYSVAPWVLSVAAADSNAVPLSFSSKGTDPAVSGLAFDHPDVMAPGSQIDSAKAAATTSSTNDVINGVIGGTAPRGDLYIAKSGTSMAAPHVSGVAALLIADNPRLSPDDVYDILIASADPKEGYPTWQVGAGFLNAFDAYKLAQSTPGNLDSFLKGKMKYAGKLVGDADYSNDPLTVGLGRVVTPEPIGLEAVTKFAYGLVATLQGLIFLLGLVALSILAFRFARNGRWISRAPPSHVRPLPFFVGGIIAGIGLVRAIPWDFSSQEFLGSYLVLVKVPKEPLGMSGDHVIWLVAGLIGLVLFAMSFARRAEKAGPALWSPRMRFYPWVFVLGLFLTVYGIIFTFDLTFWADKLRTGGSVVFLTFDYVGIQYRLLAAAIGFVILLLGLWALLGGSLQFGLGRHARAPQPSPQPVAVATPPAASAPNPQKVPAAPRPAAKPALAPKPSLARSAPPVRAGPATRATPARVARKPQPAQAAVR